MKKVLLVIAALTLVVSGVAAVSAYEAHLINVRAHVENAMSVGVDKIEFGTVFPEEWLLKTFAVGTSESFCAETQTRVTKIDYAIFVEWKPKLTGGFYPWLGDALYFGINAAPSPLAPALTPVGPVFPPGPPGALGPILSDSLYKAEPYNLTDIITVGLDVPVFEGFYNPLTDMLQADGTYAKKPSGLDNPTVIILKSDIARYFPDGVDLGADIKIQVTNVYKP